MNYYRQSFQARFRAWRCFNKESLWSGCSSDLSLSREYVRVKCSAKMSVVFPLFGFTGLRLMAGLNLNWLQGGGSSPASHPLDFGA